MKEFLKWAFIESTAKWLFIILAFEYLVAVNLSPTILTDYPLFNWIVESMAFIPAIHNFDEIAVHPEAVRFYIALVFLLLIPKSISIYYFLVRNPITGMATYVITPYTATKPKNTRLITAHLTKEEIDALPSVERSLFSRFFWSIMTLLFTYMMLVVIFMLGFESKSPTVQAMNISIASEEPDMWFQVSGFLTLSGLLLSISFFIIKDYIKYFKEKFFSLS